MLPCRHHAFQRTDCPLPPFLSGFSPSLGLACLLWFEKISFPLTSNGRCSSSLFIDLHQTTQSFDLPIFSDHCSCSDSDKLSHTTTVGPSSSPQNFDVGDLTLLYMLILGAFGKFARQNKMLAVGVCLPQTCSNAGRRFAVSRKRLHYYRRILSFPQQQIQ